MSKMLLTGEIKSAKTILKNLQSTVTLITQESNSFIYCPEDNLKRFSNKNWCKNKVNDMKF